MGKLKQVVFTDVKKAEYLVSEVDFDHIGAHQVLVKSMFTTVSPGTEKANLMGDETVGCVFPKVLGYNCAGEVVKVGEKVQSVKVGDRVVVYWSGHRNYNLSDESRVIKIEYDDISYQTAAVSFITTFPLAAIRKVKVEIGESLMVMGLGLLGQLAVKLARVAGACPVIACDPIAERREEALKNGADYVFNPFDEDFAAQVKAVSGGGVQAAIEVTGFGAGLDETLDCMAQFGRVALLGCTRNSDFSIDYYRKVHCPGITLIGAHTNARAEKESTHGNYTHNDDVRAVLKLCVSGRLHLTDIIKETHLPSECGEIYRRLADGKDFPIGLQFDWRKE